MVADAENYRLAQLALAEAREAKHMAEINNLATSSHEKICSERYDKINTTLNTIPLLLQSISDIKVKQAEGIAMNKAIGVISIALGILYIILKITQGV